MRQTDIIRLVVTETAQGTVIHAYALVHHLKMTSEFRLLTHSVLPESRIKYGGKNLKFILDIMQIC